MDDLKRQAGDDQIGVITLMRLMWKWKIVILAGILICALAALVISVLMPHVYEMDMLVENVQIGTNKVGEKVYLGDLQKIGAQINAGAFNQDVLGNLREQHKEALPKRISFKVSLENNKQFAKIAYEGVGVEIGEKILSQLFKRLQEMNLVRIGHWEKEVDGQIEDKRAELKNNKEKLAVAARTALSDKQKKLAEAKAEKQEMLAKAKADKSEKEDTIKRLQGEINDLVVQRKIDMSEKMSDMKAEKSKNRDMIKKLDKRNSEIKSSIKLIESEIELLINIRKELLSKRNETGNMGVVGELSSTIIDGYGNLAKLKQKALIDDDLVLQARLEIQELDNEIEKLKKESGVKPSEIEVLNDKIAQARLDTEELELPKKESRDELAVPDSTEKPDSDLEDTTDEKPDSALEVTTEKAKNQVALITEEIGILEANKKKVKNIVLLQAPTSGVSLLTPDTKRNVIIGAVVGLFLSLFLSIFLEYVYKRSEE